MFDKLTSRIRSVFGMNVLGQRTRAPFWTKAGPKWYLSTWWPGETLRSKQYSLLSLLAVAQTERLDPKPLIHALADEHRGRYRRRLRLLAQRIDGLATLVPALEKTPDSLSEGVVLAIRFGSQSGTLRMTYQYLMETEKPRVAFPKTMRSNYMAYWLVLAGTIMFLFTFLMFFISPTLRKISQEFEMPLPITFRYLQIFWEIVSNNLLWLCLVAVAIGWIFRSSTFQRFFRRQVADRLLSRSSLSRSAQLFRMLSVAVEAGKPLSGSLSTLAKYHFDKKMRQRLLLARNEVEQGVQAWSSLSDAKIISPAEFEALNDAPSNRVQSWTLQRLANIKQEMADQRVATRTAFLHPIAILVFASIVLFICYSLFSFNTNIMHSLAG